LSPRQRQGVLLLGLAALGAIGVFALVAGYVSDVRDEVGDKVGVLYLDQDVTAYTAVTPEMVREEEVPERWIPETAIRDPNELSGMVAANDLPAGSLLEGGMLVPEPELSPGQREIAILVDAETGVAGKIGPGDVVDVLATFAAQSSGTSDRSEIVVTGARVIDVGLPRSLGNETDQQAPNADAQSPGQPTSVVPITFALSVRDSLVLTHAESFADEVRLALLRPGEPSEIVGTARVFSPG
jgi:pilus assembly protein CpaB